MIIDLDELVNEEEMHSENIRKANVPVHGVPA